MTSSILTRLNILAGSQPNGEGGGGFEMMVPLLLMGIIFYFLLIRPQRKRQKELEAKISSMKKGDKVVSAGGIHGSITNIKDTTVIVKIAENVKIEFEKASIAQVIPRGSAKKSGQDSDKDEDKDEGKEQKK